jgi:hypothetical protein
VKHKISKTDKTSKELEKKFYTKFELRISNQLVELIPNDLHKRSISKIDGYTTWMFYYGLCRKLNEKLFFETYEPFLEERLS